MPRPTRAGFPRTAWGRLMSSIRPAEPRSMWPVTLQPQRRAIRNSLKVGAIRSALALARALALRDHPLQGLRKLDPRCPGYDCRLRDLVQNDQRERDQISRMDSAARQQIVGKARQEKCIDQQGRNNRDLGHVTSA